MKFFVSVAFLLISLSLSAQSLTGIWRGYFVSGVGYYKQRYKYEVQINNKEKDALGGVTYSYKTTVFYGKASAQGVYMRKSKSLILKEYKLVEVKIQDQSEPCLMTCYLDYIKEDGVETLQGTFTSINMNNNSDCGSGTVYLEKVPDSDFEKEDFIISYEKKQNSKTSVAKKTASPKKTSASTVKKPITPPSTAKTTNKKTAAPVKPSPVTKPPVTKKTDVVKKTTPAAGTPVTKSTPAKEETVPVISQKTETNSATTNTVVPENKIKTLPPAPPVIKERENSLVKKLYTSSKTIKIEIYDNGSIDNDTISVYHNNEPIALRKRLTHDPISFTINADESDAYHEFVMVAENLGEIPPNTALMVITTGDKRYELYLVSTNEKNAKVIIEFKKQQ